ncbi:hypothetical protein ABBQ38_004256 [Trebouxia sp. C0009 RCD-2024]
MQVLQPMNVHSADDNLNEGESPLATDRTPFQSSSTWETENTKKWSSQIQVPIGLAIYILILAITAFACGLRGLPWWYQLLAACMLLLTFSLQWILLTVDPGIIVPQPFKDPIITALDSTGAQLPDRTAYEKDYKGQWMHQTSRGFEKYCSSCNIWRPPRSHHCSVCGYCMVRSPLRCGGHLHSAEEPPLLCSISCGWPAGSGHRCSWNIMEIAS